MKNQKLAKRQESLPSISHHGGGALSLKDFDPATPASCIRKKLRRNARRWREAAESHAGKALRAGPLVLLIVMQP